ncbi:eukaryotic translation initiation factor 4E1 isoform X2 [Procambarus clarkii]|uniref:eukaryotic translation initiation factor 4E1 isoform X2 n=1 Tax=Procambarus clarkii TaxID=6728 RepID=UPI0037433B6E
MTEQQRQCEEEEHKCHYVALESLLVKHPLKNTWTMWYYKVKSSNVWMECHTEIASFNTVEDFWAVYHHLNLPSEIERGSGYSMFRKGIKPMWEDSHNWNGGRWLFTIQESNDCQKLDDIWMEMLILLIGEAFGDNNEQVCGCVVSVWRKFDKIGIWTADASKKENILEIGKICKIALKESYNESVNWMYRSHSAQRKYGVQFSTLYTL